MLRECAIYLVVAQSILLVSCTIMSNSVGILSLPDELILKIFDFCDIQTLGRLSSTCQKLKRLIHTEESCWRDKSRLVLGSNMHSSPMQKRCKPFLSMRKRCEVSSKWRKGLSTKSTVVKYERCMPWIYLDQNYLFCSKERMIVQYQRKNNGNVSFAKTIRITPHSDDVAKFVVNENEVVTAGRDGTLGRWRKSDLRSIHSIESHSKEIHCVDAKMDIIVTGSRDTTIKIWNALPKNTVCQKQIDMDIRVLSVAIMPSNKYFVVGLPGTNDTHPLQLFDLERGAYVTKLGEKFQRGAGILDIYPEFEHLFLSCGYDTTVKLWDIRSPERHVATWMDPYDNGIYCVKSDHNVTIVSGANRNGVVHIWDKRWCKCQYIYHVNEYNSPVYSVAFDASHLFVAFDKATLQFSYLSPVR